MWMTEFPFYSLNLLFFAFLFDLITSKCLLHLQGFFGGGSYRSRGTQRPNVSKYARSVSNGFLCALEACLVNLELP